MKGTKKEENGKNFHLVLIATGTIILNILVGIGQISNVESAIDMVMQRRFVKIKQTNKYNKPKLLSMKNKMKSIYLVPLAVQQVITEKYGS